MFLRRRNANATTPVSESMLLARSSLKIIERNSVPKSVFGYHCILESIEEAMKLSYGIDSKYVAPLILLFLSSKKVHFIPGRFTAWLGGTGIELLALSVNDNQALFKLESRLPTWFTNRNKSDRSGVCSDNIHLNNNHIWIEYKEEMKEDGIQSWEQYLLHFKIINTAKRRTRVSKHSTYLSLKLSHCMSSNIADITGMVQYSDGIRYFADDQCLIFTWKYICKLSILKHKIDIICKWNHGICKLSNNMFTIPSIRDIVQHHNILDVGFLLNDGNDNNLLLDKEDKIISILYCTDQCFQIDFIGIPSVIRDDEISS